MGLATALPPQSAAALLVPAMAETLAGDPAARLSCRDTCRALLARDYRADHLAFALDAAIREARLIRAMAL